MYLLLEDASNTYGLCYGKRLVSLVLDSRSNELIDSCFFGSAVSTVYM